jgi:hypothetical protein
MSTYVTLRLSADPNAFEQAGAAHADAIDRVMEVAKRNGLIAHRWLGGDGEVLAVDEWPDAESFQRFFEDAGPDIGPVLEAAGVTAPPDITYWSGVEINDTYGWGA